MPHDMIKMRGWTDIAGASFLVASLVIIENVLGLPATFLLLVIVAMMIAIGRLVGAFTAVNEPFVQFVAGFSILCHVIMLIDFVVPVGMGLFLTIATAVFAATYIFTVRQESKPSSLLLGIFIAVFTLVWCKDLLAQLRKFESTGNFEFFSDILIHAGTVAQFGSPIAVGRGILSLADIPFPLYHVASYMPAALLVRLADMSSISATILIWIPLGILTMSAGIAALGIALGGRRLSLVALSAVAVFPYVGDLFIQNGFLSFVWLLDIAPGIPYSLGVASASIAMLIYWFKSKNWPTLALAFALCATCLLVRANTFIWLAPTMILSIVFGFERLTTRNKTIVFTGGVLLLCIFLAILSRNEILTDPSKFFFTYMDIVHSNQQPTNYQEFYSGLAQTLGRGLATIVGVPIVFLGTLGLWLPIFLITSIVCAIRHKLESYDAIPFVLIVVALIMMMLAPMASNGDISEFRHRPGPLLVAVIIPWSIRFCYMISAPYLADVRPKSAWIASLLVAIGAMLAMAFNMSAARRPTMNWALSFYGIQIQTVLLDVAATLRKTSDRTSRFSVANQSGDSHNSDDATTLAALSGVPAYISRPQLFTLRQDSIGEEARRRMDVVIRLKDAASLTALREIMLSENISHYIVTNADQVSFDPERREAQWIEGSYAIYRSK